jgi:hypothetical protein
MRRERHHRGLATLAAIGLLGLAGCSSGSDGAAPTDELARTTVSSTSTTPSVSSTTVPGSTTSVLPPCSELGTDSSYVTPATWLPAEVPEGWRLDAAATVRTIGAPGRPGATQFVFLDGDTVTGMLAMGTGAVALDGSTPESVTIRGRPGTWGFMGGRRLEAGNPFLVWQEGGIDRWATASGMDRAAVMDALAPVELSVEPVRLTDPTGRLVQVAERPREPGSTMVVLGYEVPGGTATSPLSSGTVPDVGTPSGGAEPTDRVLVVIEQFAPGGAGILVDTVSGWLTQAIGWQLVTVDGRPVLRTPAEAAIPVASGGAQVSAVSDVAVAVSVTGAPSTAEADAVIAGVTPVEPSDERLVTARVDVGEPGEIDLPACAPDPAG